MCCPGEVPLLKRWLVYQSVVMPILNQEASAMISCLDYYMVSRCKCCRHQQSSICSFAIAIFSLKVSQAL